MCVNDILVCGAEPLFFLDYYATGSLNVTEAAAVISGIAEGCNQSKCALIGGETAEMAGMYIKDEYDLAGFSVGAVRKSQILPRVLEEGDVLIGLPSSGVHSNGYSLVRKLVEKSRLPWTAAVPFACPDLPSDATIADALLQPTKIYVAELLPYIQQDRIKALAHITGGGLLDNLPRVLPRHLHARIDFQEAQWSLPPVFRWLQSIANLSQTELLRTFNCGIGMIVVVSASEAASMHQELAATASLCYDLGARRPIVLGRLEQRTTTDIEKNAPQVVTIGTIQ
jgi:phosphoribosylformylglycinamidine cyclo-ligase